MHRTPAPESRGGKVERRPEPEPERGPEPDIDPDILDVEPMRRNFGELGPLTDSLFAMFVETTEQLEADLQARLREGDIAAARLAAHSAAGAARTVGARRLAGFLAAIEDSLVRGDLGEAAGTATRLPAALADVRAMIARL